MSKHAFRLVTSAFGLAQLYIDPRFSIATVQKEHNRVNPILIHIRVVLYKQFCLFLSRSLISGGSRVRKVIFEVPLYVLPIAEYRLSLVAPVVTQVRLSLKSRYERIDEFADTQCVRQLPLLVASMIYRGGLRISFYNWLLT
jgi:hypothetical protein